MSLPREDELHSRWRGKETDADNPFAVVGAAMPVKAVETAYGISDRT